MEDTVSTNNKTAKTPAPLAMAENIIAVASGKGGVGKTWLSITLAHHVARSGRRVLLFDGDIGLANIDVQLGLTPKKDLASVFAGKNALADVVMSYENEGFDIIAGRSGSGGFGMLSHARLEDVKRQLLEISKQYDLVILDLGAGVEQHVRSLSAIASRCLVVLTDEPTSMTDAYAFIKLSTAKNPQQQIQVVINQATTQKEGERTYAAINKACTTFLKFSPPCAGIIRRDPKVKDAIRSQKPIIIKSPGATAATDTAALSVKLMVKR
ncbi:MAG: AAA family ATPase [Alphaproteobacteria bacterium]|nr:AAA family ATPase [Alphaproteobacteria bacterium]